MPLALNSHNPTTMSGTLAVVSQSGSSLSFFDLTTGARTAYMPNLIPEPHELLLDPKRHLIYCSHAYAHGHFWQHGDNGHQISVIDPARHEVVGVIETGPALGPHALVLDGDRDILWCSYEEHEESESAGGGVVGIDLKTRKVVKRVGSGTKTHWFVVTKDGKKAFTCNKTAPFISVLDLENEVMVGKIETPGGTEECSISRDGRFAYFPTPGTQFGKTPERPEVLVIDTASDQIVDRIQLGAGALSTYVAGDGRIMVGEYRYDAEGKPAKGRLSMYSAGTHEHAGAVDIGLMPLTLRSSPDGKLGFTANIFEGSVSVLDLSAMKNLKTLVVDTEKSQLSNLCQGAHGMVYFP
jgi:DNA-binding beta-propeller fold protein YncE